MFVEGLASSGDNMLRLFSEFNHNTWLGHETTVDIEDISFILIIQYLLNIFPTVYLYQSVS